MIMGLTQCMLSRCNLLTFLIDEDQLSVGDIETGMIKDDESDGDDEMVLNKAE